MGQPLLPCRYADRQNDRQGRLKTLPLRTSLRAVNNRKVTVQLGRATSLNRLMITIKQNNQVIYNVSVKGLDTRSI